MRKKLNCMLVFGILGAAATAVPRPIVTSQGAFTLIDYPNSTSTQIWSVNGRGEMVGVYVDGARVNHGFLYSRGKFTTIDYPGAALTLLNGINTNGDIVGEYATTATGPHHGFLYSSGRFGVVDFPGGATTGVVGIAANGDMVGYYDNPGRGYFVSGDKFTKIDYPNGSPTVLGSISPQGVIIGSAAVSGVSRAFVIRNGETTTYEHPGAAGFTNAIGMNAAGDIVGRYRDAAAVSHGYLLSGGKFISFDFPGATFTGAAGITPDGDIVGRCTISGVTHGFLMKRGQQPRYTLTDLGTLGGKEAIAYGINNAGAISGWASVASGEQHPVLWRDGKTTDLGGLAGRNGAGSIPTGSLQIAVAYELDRADPQGEDFCLYGTHRTCVAAIWKDGRYTQMPTLGGPNSIGYAMNDRGQMVGVSETASVDPKCKAPQRLTHLPAIWATDSGTVTELPLLAGDTNGWAILMNDKGEIIGGTGTCDNTSSSINGPLKGRHAVLWENGAPRDLGDFGGEGDNVPVGINNRTEVVGASAAKNGLHGFLWSREDGLEDIGAIDADPNGLPSSINNGRQIVGASCDEAFNCRAFLWERNTMTDLNDLIPADASMYLVFATWINDVGEIVGWGIDKKTERTRAFVLRPAKASALVAPKTSSRPRILPVAARKVAEQRGPARQVVR